MNIYLIGYRCTGKTTVGKRLAHRLGRSFVDTDRELVRQTGSAISDMVRDKGWPFFRKLEKAVLKRIGQGGRSVVATGGGVVLDEENVQAMKDSGVLIWLRATPETLKNRLASDGNTHDFRPGLTEKGPLAEIETVLSRRVPLYEKAADLIVETDNRDVEAVAETIIDLLERMKDVKHIRNPV